MFRPVTVLAAAASIIVGSGASLAAPPSPAASLSLSNAAATPARVSARVGQRNSQEAGTLGVIALAGAAAAFTLIAIGIADDDGPDSN